MVHDLLEKHSDKLLDKDLSYQDARDFFVQELNKNNLNKIIEPDEEFFSCCPDMSDGFEFDLSKDDDAKKLRSMILEKYIDEQPYPVNKIATLHTYENMAPKDIAKELKLKDSTTRSYLYRFIAKAKEKVPILFRKQLDKEILR